MKTKWSPPCSNCGKRVKFGNTNGMPNMVGFVYDEGQIVNLCQECIIELGKMSNEEKDNFFERLGIKKKKGGD